MRLSLRSEFVLRAVTYGHATDSGFTGRLKPVPHIATKTAYIPAHSDFSRRGAYSAVTLVKSRGC